MKFAGHTMGAPGRPLEDCIDLFAEIGFDGIEVRVAPDGQIDPRSFSASDAENARKRAEEAGLDFACLTPYARAFAGSARDAGRRTGDHREGATIDGSRPEGSGGATSSVGSARPSQPKLLRRSRLSAVARC